MSLDKIISKIGEQAKAQAKKILEEAEEKAGLVGKYSENELEGLKAEIKREEASIENELRNAIVLPAKLKVRGDDLAEKNRMIERAFDNAMKFSDEEYKKVLAHLVSQLPKEISGTVFPAKGKEEITKKYFDESKTGFEIGKPVEEIRGGFLFKAGKIEYDCSFETILRKVKERMEPEIAPLFADSK